MRSRKEPPATNGSGEGRGAEKRKLVSPRETASMAARLLDAVAESGVWKNGTGKGGAGAIGPAQEKGKDGGQPSIMGDDGARASAAGGCAGEKRSGVG